MPENKIKLILLDLGFFFFFTKFNTFSVFAQTEFCLFVHFGIEYDNVVSILLSLQRDRICHRCCSMGCNDW